MKCLFLVVFAFVFAGHYSIKKDITYAFANDRMTWIKEPSNLRETNTPIIYHFSYANAKIERFFFVSDLPNKMGFFSLSSRLLK